MNSQIDRWTNFLMYFRNISLTLAKTITYSIEYPSPRTGGSTYKMIYSCELLSSFATKTFTIKRSVEKSYIKFQVLDKNQMIFLIHC